MFNPELGSILSGWVDSVTEEEGIKVSLGFFAGVYVPRDKCPEVRVVACVDHNSFAHLLFFLAGLDY